MAETETRRDFEARLIERAWQDEAFADLLRTNPRVVLGWELGLEVPPEVKVQVLEETATTKYLVLPLNPDDPIELSDEDLDLAAGGAAPSAIRFLTRFWEMFRPQ